MLNEKIEKMAEVVKAGLSLKGFDFKAEELNESCGICIVYGQTGEPWLGYALIKEDYAVVESVNCGRKRIEF